MVKGKRIAILIMAILIGSVFTLVTPVSAPAPLPGWYFKPGYDNYAPSGMPDFDQKQDAWQRINCGPNGTFEISAAGDDEIVGTPGPFSQWIVPGPNGKLDTMMDSVPGQDDFVQWSFCGPVAVANCFWWFDSKFEKETTGLPGDGNDTFPLVKDYGAGDDHNFSNVPLLVEQLACNMSTCSKGTTNVTDMVTAIDNWLNATGLNDTLYVHKEKAPDFYWIADEINRSQDVILLLGFWENQSGDWKRIGGHYVTCAGVNLSGMQLALSDPYFDYAEDCGLGRVLPGPHTHFGTPDTVHNNATNVSHDFYIVQGGSTSPGGDWWIPQYAACDYDRIYLWNFYGQNCPAEFVAMQGDYLFSDIHTEIEYAVVISPKPNLEVNKTVWDPETGKWVKSVNAHINDTLRFNCTIHNSGGVNLTQIRFWDILDCSLNYSGDATLKIPSRGIDRILDLETTSINQSPYTHTFKQRVLHPNTTWDGVPSPRPGYLWDPYDPLGEYFSKYYPTAIPIFEELCPESKLHYLHAWDDTNNDSRVSACDQLWLESYEEWYHVDNVPYTLLVNNSATNQSMYFDSVLDYEDIVLSDPEDTEWIDVGWIEACCDMDRYTLVNWTDNASYPDGNLSVNDTIRLRNERTLDVADYAVTELAKDLVVSLEWDINHLLNRTVTTTTFKFTGPPPPEFILELEPCQTITIEYNATVITCGVDFNTFRAKGNPAGALPDVWYYSNEDVVSITVPCVTGEATDAGGGTKDVYYTGETVFATGSGFTPGSRVDIYITEDEKWNDGMPINSTVYVNVSDVLVDAEGKITGFPIWPNPIPGEYDMIFDANQNGYYNVGIDAVDHPNHPGFIVRGQVPTVTPLGIAALIGLLSLIATSKLLRMRKKR